MKPTGKEERLEDLKPGGKICLVLFTKCFLGPWMFGMVAAASEWGCGVLTTSGGDLRASGHLAPLPLSLPWEAWQTSWEATVIPTVRRQLKVRMLCRQAPNITRPFLSTQNLT